MGRHRKPSNPWWWPWVAVIAVLASATFGSVLAMLVTWTLFVTRGG